MKKKKKNIKTKFKNKLLEKYMKKFICSTITKREMQI